MHDVERTARDAAQREATRACVPWVVNSLLVFALNIVASLFLYLSTVGSFILALISIYMIGKAFTEALDAYDEEIRRQRAARVDRLDGSGGGED